MHFRKAAATCLFLLGLLVSPPMAAVAWGQSKLQPNILIVFTDDQGWGDLSCYGSTTNPTPRMNQLAAEGTRFTNFYSQDVCGPSRSALLTGRYPIRSQGWSMPAEEITFAEKLQQVGYQTACIGKWDVSNRKPIEDRMPLAQGFDYYFGPLGANDSGKVDFHENNQPAGSTKDMGSLIDLYTDKAIDYLENRRVADKPFMLYLAHTMMHTIIDASEEFRGTSDGSLYGDVVAQFDHQTGRLLAKVDELGLRDNTLVIYTSDNGPWNQPAYIDNKKGHPEGSIFWGDNGPLRDGKGSCYEAGSRVPCIVRWPNRVPAGRVSDAIFATIDFFPTFANLAGYEVPSDRMIDGVDQTTLLLGESETGARDSFYYQGNGVRLGKWKYLKATHKVPGYAKDKQRAEVEELYDLEADIGETTNLAEQHPQKVEELKKLLEEIEGADQLSGGIAPALYDDFSKADDKLRQALRGEWQFADGQARCVADPELYAQFHNHGPILRWPVKFSSGIIDFDFRARGVDRVVFTLNDNGHVFRIALGNQGGNQSSHPSRILGWSKLSSESKPDVLAAPGVPSLESWAGQWVQARITIKGDMAQVQLNDFQIDIEHPSLARPKSEVTLSFASGQLDVRNVRLYAAGM